MIFTNARFIFPDGIRDGMEIVESGGRICALRERSPFRQTEGIDLGGNFVAPGFVDLHLHGGNGRDTMEASVEAFRAICDFHASGGTTSLLLTTATAPIAQLTAVLESVRVCMPELPQIAGVHLEGPFLSAARAGAQRKEFMCNPDSAAIDALLQFRDVLKRVTLAPELPGALEAIDSLGQNGVTVSGGHSDATDAEAKRAYERGMRQVTHTFNCMSSMRKRNGERVAGLLEFALSEPEMMCELIADGRHVSTTLMRMLYRAKGRDGICLVTDATAGAGLPNESNFSLGGLRAVVRDGACWLADGSALAGSAARMIDLVRTMVREAGVPLPEAIAMASANPARALGLKNKGGLEAGNDADFVVISPDLEVVQTFAAGELIFPRAS